MATTSERFDKAIEKLYNAFHNGALNPECCNHCAVGNICDNTDSWKNLTDTHGSTQLNYVGIVNENIGRRFNGYKPSELLQIEAAFLSGCGYPLPFTYKSRKSVDRTSKDTLFDGLCSAVTFLCQLEGIPNIMDFEGLFDFEPSIKPAVVAIQLLSNGKENQHGFKPQTASNDGLNVCTASGPIAVL